jgi:hypothetical protein
MSPHDPRTTALGPHAETERIEVRALSGLLLIDGLTGAVCAGGVRLSRGVSSRWAEAVR